MKPQKLQKRLELKRMKASLSQIKKESKRKPNLIECLKCKQELEKNFVFIYKKNNELKGKMCLSCNQKSTPLIIITNCSNRSNQKSN